MNAHPNYSEWTKEQKDEFAKERMRLMREKNEKIKQRHAEVEADRIKAEKLNSSVTSNRKLPCKKVTSKDTEESEETGTKCKSTREWDLDKYDVKNWEPNSKPAYKEYRSSHSASGHHFATDKDVIPEINKSRRQYFNNEKYDYNQHKNASRKNDDERFSSKRRVKNFSSDSRDIYHGKKQEITSSWKNNKYREEKDKEASLRNWIENVSKLNEENKDIVLENIIVPHGKVIDLTNENDNIIVPHEEVIDLTNESDTDSKNINAITEETVTVKKKNLSKWERYDRSPESGSFDDDVACNTEPAIQGKELEDGNAVFSKNEEYVEKKNERSHASTQEYKNKDHKNSNENILLENVVPKENTCNTKPVMQENKLDIGYQVSQKNDDFLKKKNNNNQCHFDTFNKNMSCGKQKFENNGIQRERFIVKKNKKGRSVEFVNNSVLPKTNTFHSDSNYFESASNTHEDGIWSNTQQTDIKWKLSDEEYKDNKMIMRKDKSDAKPTKDKFRRRSKMAKSNEKNETFSDAGWSTVSDE